MMSAPTLAQPRAQADPPQEPIISTPRLPVAPVLFAFVATTIAVLGAVSGIHGVISDWGWMTQVSIMVVALLAVTNTARYFSAPRFLPPVLGLLTTVVLLTVLFFANTALFGFLPGPATYNALLQVWELANDQMGAQIPPVQSTGVIVFSVTVWAALVALAVDTLAFTLRAPIFSGIPLALLLVIASLFKPNGAGMLSVAVGCVGFLLILAASRHYEATMPKRRGAPQAVEVSGTATKAHHVVPRKPGNSLIQGTVLVAGALVSLLVLPNVIPGFTKGMLVEGTRPSWGNVATNIDPMISLGNDLRSNSSGTVLHYYTDSKTPLYLRTSVIGNLEGAKWLPDDTLTRVPVSEILPVTTNPTLPIENSEVTTRVVTDKYRGVWLPLPEKPQSISGLAGNWRWSPDTSTILAESGSKPKAQDFIALSYPAEISAETLTTWSDEYPDGYFDSVNPEYSALPNDLPESLWTTLDRATAAAKGNSSFERAVAIQNYLRSSAFTYSEKTPVEDGYDGSGMKVIDAFLDKKAGYCIHFASTMAVMARAINIPSRIVTGYSPGTATGDSVSSSKDTTLNEFTVSSRNAHAWPELYFHGIGWVAFEPTPGQGVPPAYAPAVAAASQSQGEDPRPSNPTAKRSAQSAPTSTPSSVAEGTHNTPQEKALSLWPVLGALVLLGLGGIPWLLRRMQRTSRVNAINASTANGTETGAAAAWAELVAIGIDHSLPMRQDESAGDYARRMSTRFPAVSAALLLLSSSYERQRYTRSQLTDSSAQELSQALKSVNQAMSQAYSPIARFGLLIWPRSVFAPKPLEPAINR